MGIENEVAKAYALIRYIDLVKTPDLIIDSAAKAIVLILHWDFQNATGAELLDFLTGDPLIHGARLLANIVAEIGHVIEQIVYEWNWS